MAERKYRIHPAIGIARVGNATRATGDFFFIGPERPGIPANYDPQTKTFHAFKLDGRVKPQAARFRIFEYEKDPNGKFHPRREISVGNGMASKITWTVHLANRKASFGQFLGQKGAMANPLFSDYALDAMRNPKVHGLDQRREKLELDPGPHSIASGDPGPKDFTINRPPLEIKTLGELRTDAKGRLIVIGGMGKSHFDKAIPRADGKKEGKIGHYANNDSWFDDVSDGPVQAEIVIDGKTHQADEAWVMVGPPDFAPTIRSYRSLYDTVVDIIVREMPPLPADDGLFSGPLADIAAMKAAWKSNGTLGDFRPSFTRHIYPILSAVADMWRVFARPNAPKKNFHAVLDPANYGDLGGPNSNNGAGADIFAMVRDPNTLDKKTNQVEPFKMPLILGDYYLEENGRGGKTDPAFFHAVSKLQYALLKAWTEGQFERDWNGLPAANTGAVTPEGLDRAALENAVGGPYFPGIEASWLMTKTKVYRAPFRIARGSVIGRLLVPLDVGQPPQTRDIKLEAGTFSQQMALPWQADFLDCRTENHDIPPKRSIGWWPLQRPVQVFRAENPAVRVEWARHPNGSGFGRKYQAMVDDWYSLGFILGDDGQMFETEGPGPLVS